MKVIDLHCDTILKIMNNTNSNLRKNNFSVDIEKLKKADSMVQFFALFIDLKIKNPLKYCMKMLDKFYIEMDKNKEYISHVKNYNDIIENKNRNKMSAFLTIEEGGALEGKIYNLRNFYRLGVRLITLLWNYPNELGYPNCKEKYMNKGLTSFGKEVVEEMNKLGMIVDVSHMSDAGFYDVARICKEPFVASHSNSRTIKNHPRNLSDDMIKVLSEKGGVMGINFEKSFLANKDKSMIEDMIKHIEYIKNIGGIDVISIGSDFDGISDGLEIENIGQIDKLTFALNKRGFSDDDIEKIFYKNALRVINLVCK